MSVRAYLVYEDVKIIDGKRYIHEDIEFLWNNWSQSEIWDILYPYINDMTNEDCIGEIEIVYDEWEDFKNKYKNLLINSNIYKVVNEYKDIFSKIDCLFKKGEDYIRIKMY